MRAVLSDRVRSLTGAVRGLISSESFRLLVPVVSQRGRASSVDDVPFSF